MKRKRNPVPAAVAPGASLPALDPRLAAWLGLAVIAAFAVAQILVLTRPGRVGDYFAESDFYGAYAEGARLIQGGHWLPGRYGVTGPAYEAALALAGSFPFDLYTAACGLSLLAGLAALLAVRGLAARRLGPWASAGATLLLATNPWFFRYAHAATPDLLALGLACGGLALLLAGEPRRARFAVAGAALALAALTRYNTLVLLPVALWAARTRPARLALGAGFALLAGPWLLFSLFQGGQFRFQFHHNVAAEVFARGQGHGLDYYEEHLESQFRSPWDVLRRDPGAVTGYIARSVALHLGSDAAQLLRWPLAILAAAGAALAVRARRERWGVALVIAWACLYASLVPLIYSPRYSLALLPFYVLAAAAALAWAPRAIPDNLPARLGRAALALVPAALGFAAIVASLRAEDRDMPRAPRVLGAALRPLARPGDRIITRKAQVAYYAGVPAVMFPHTHTLPELAAFAHRERIRWLFYSEREGRLRPDYWYLGDTSAVPGLIPRATSALDGAVLYEIGPDFGREPAWMARPELVELHRARAAQHADSTHVIALYQEAQRSRAAGDALRARRQLAIVCDLAPSRPEPWLALGNLCLDSRDAEGAARAFEGALRADPTNREGHLGLGWARMFGNDPSGAAAAWRPWISTTDNPVALRGMLQLFTQVHDPEAVRLVSSRLASLGEAQP